MSILLWKYHLFIFKKHLRINLKNILFCINIFFEKRNTNKCKNQIKQQNKTKKQKAIKI